MGFTALFDQILEEMTLGRFEQGMAMLANTLDTAAVQPDSLAIASAALRMHPLDQMLREDPLYVGAPGKSASLPDRLALAAMVEAPGTCGRTGEKLFLASRQLRLREGLIRRQSALAARLENSWQTGQRICLLGGETLLHSTILAGQDLGNITVLATCPAIAGRLRQVFGASLEIVLTGIDELLNLSGLRAGLFDLVMLGDWAGDITNAQLADLLSRLEPRLTNRGAIVFASLVRGHIGAGFARAYLGWEPRAHDLDRVAGSAANLRIHQFELTPGCMAWAEFSRSNQQGETRTMIETSLQAIADGDQAAFTQLFRDWQPKLVAYASGLLAGDRSTALDIVDEAMMAVWQQAGRFSGQGSGEGWLRRIVRNKAIDWLRHEGRAKNAHPANSTLFEMADPATSPEAEAIAQSEASALRSLLAALPIEQREAIWLCYFEERPLAEIAELCGCPTNTVKTRLFHARRKLRHQFEAQTFA